MYLETTVNINKKGFYNEKGRGKILAIEPLENGGIYFSGEYRNTDDAPVKVFSNTYSAEEVETLYQAVKSSLTPDLNGVLSIFEQTYKAFQVVMAAEFGITTNQIQIK